MFSGGRERVTGKKRVKNLKTLPFPFSCADSSAFDKKQKDHMFGLNCYC